MRMLEQGEPSEPVSFGQRPNANSPVDVAHALLIAAFSLSFAPEIFAALPESGHGPDAFPACTAASHFCRIFAIVIVSFDDSLVTVPRHFTSACAGVTVATKPRTA